MPSRYASPFDELLESARQQFDAVTGKTRATIEKTRATIEPQSTGSSVKLPTLPAERGGQSGLDHDAQSHTVVSGTSAGIPFKLRPR